MMLRVIILFSICIAMGASSTSYAQAVDSIKQNATSKTANQLARQIVDQLMNIENEKAAQTLLALEHSFPNYSLLGFMKITPLWAKAESTYDEETRLRYLHAVIEQLTQNIQSAQSEIRKHPDSADWQLNLGLSQAFAGLAYIRLGEWLKAYRAGRAGRDTLRVLVQTHPKIEDAYFVLGFYEYYTGNVPFYLAWLTWLVDMSGDRALGLQYIQRAITHAPIFSPEASRLLLVQTETNPQNACEKKKHAHNMAEQYPNNVQLPWLEKQFNHICSSHVMNQ
ncbi:MAG: hypothetical protein L3J61_03550 [Ghiorsea sp.]|nr:hypothetical protein [Ghiorsea sp.]